ncbi:hypothetical protein PG987_006916 [Apiospora arundinis]
MRALVAPKSFQAWRVYRNTNCSWVVSSPASIPALVGSSYARRHISTIRSVDNSIDEATFYEQAYVTQEPLVIRDCLKPSVSTWFHENKHGTVTLDSKLTENPNTPEMPYEYVRTSTDDDLALANFTGWLRGNKTPRSSPNNMEPEDQVRFSQFTAPIGLLSKAIEFNAQQENSTMRYKRLYIAQMPINELTPELQLDLEAPPTSSVFCYSLRCLQHQYLAGFGAYLHTVASGSKPKLLYAASRAKDSAAAPA